MANTKHYDAMIIGSGQGGNPLAVALKKRGERVVMIELGPLGGTCINTGCTPTKTLIGSAQIAHYARNAARWGVHAGEVSVDLPAILKRKEAIVSSMRSGWEQSLGGVGQPELVRGRARFVGPKLVSRRR
jgi:pyruvate/2-oxoglutarate dehydrogenase complex dihydrolipoamide dehydrogenase (E3) component